MTLSPLLHRLAMANTPRLVLALRPQDPLPEWTTHLVYLDRECKVAHQGPKNKMLVDLKGKIAVVGELPGADVTHKQGQVFIPKAGAKLAPPSELPDVDQDEDSLGEELPPSDISDSEMKKLRYNRRSLGITEYSVERRERRALERSGRELLVKMEGVCVKYGDKVVLGNWTQGLEDQKTRGLWWDVRRGDRWGIFGPNGEGILPESIMIPELMLPRKWENNSLVIDMFRSSSDVCSSDQVVRSVPPTNSRSAGHLDI